MENPDKTIKTLFQKLGVALEGEDIDEIVK